MIRLILLSICLFSTNAYAITQMTRFSCAHDYLKYCFPKPIESKEVEDCFRQVGKNLEHECIDALKQEGLITEEDKTKTTEPIIIGDKPEKKSEPSTIKSNILQNIAKRVAAKLKETEPKIKTIAAEVAQAIKTKPSSGRKVQRGGKWDGYPLYLEWKNNRELGGELTPYGYEDRN